METKIKPTSGKIIVIPDENNQSLFGQAAEIIKLPDDYQGPLKVGDKIYYEGELVKIFDDKLMKMYGVVYENQVLSYIEKQHKTK